MMKRKLKYILFIVFAAVFSFPSLQTSSATFKDVPTSFWAAEEIRSLHSQGIINGYGDGTFQPNRNISRAHVAKMLVKALDRHDNGLQAATARFTDVPKNHPEFPYIERAAQLGIIVGKGDGTFGPNDPINRAAVSLMIARAYQINEGNEGKNSAHAFSDVPANHYAKNEIVSLYLNGILTGYNDGSFKPNGYTTRASFTTILDRTMKVTKPITNSDQPKHAVTIKATSLNVREAPTTASDRIGLLQQNATVEVYEQIGDWLKIKYGQQSGYIHSNYVSVSSIKQPEKPTEQPNAPPDEEENEVEQPNEPDEEEPFTEPKKALVTASSLNVRQHASTSAKIIGSLPYGSIIDVLAVQDGWGEIDYNGTIGYISATYLNFENPALPQLDPNKQFTLVIDAGHGGHDPGTTSGNTRGTCNVDLICEKDIVLKIAKKLATKFSEENINIVMTRESDRYLSLDERVNLANYLNADVFVSIHVNAGPESAHGTETYWNSRNSGPESKRLAQLLQNELVKELKTNDRKVKEGNFQVIRETTMAGALVEVGFLSNPTELQNLLDDSFQERAAEAMYNGIMTYFRTK